MELLLRKAAASQAVEQFQKEARFILAVRNDPETRSMSGNTAIIPWGSHLAWYVKATEDPKRHIYVVQCAGDDIGMVRLDEDESNPGTAEIHVALLPDFRQKGFGLLAIKKACQEGFRLGCHVLVARVKTANQRSLRVFETVGFVREHEQVLGDSTFVTLTLVARDG